MMYIVLTIGLVALMSCSTIIYLVFYVVRNSYDEECDVFHDKQGKPALILQGRILECTSKRKYQRYEP